jgi:Lon protease-like protein
MPPREILPLFPLEQVVLFPRTQVELHVFEPRYRQMVAAALRGQRRIGMVAVPPEHTHAMADDPPVYPVGCAGRIVRSERLPEGRYQIVLRGTQRFRIREEGPRSHERLYRVAQIELLEETAGEPDRMRVQRERAVELLIELLRGLRQGGDSDLERVRSHLAGLDDAGFTDGLCQGIGFSPTEKQALLEADRPGDRLERLVELLDFRLAGLRASGAAGSGRLH